MIYEVEFTLVLNSKTSKFKMNKKDVLDTNELRGAMKLAQAINMNQTLDGACPTILARITNTKMEKE